MSHEERGVYITLLCIQWSQGSLAADDFTRVAGGSFKGCLDRIKSKFLEGKDGRFRNERMEFERLKQSEYREKCAEAGKKGGGNPNFQKGKRNPYYKDKGTIISPLSGKDKGKINSPSPSPSPSPDPVTDLQSPMRGGRFAPPALEEVKLQAVKMGLPETEAFKFHAHYESNGWRVGSNPMKSWKAAMTNWKLRSENYGTNHANSQQRGQPPPAVKGSSPVNGF